MKHREFRFTDNTVRDEANIQPHEKKKHYIVYNVLYAVAEWVFKIMITLIITVGVSFIITAIATAAVQNITFADAISNMLNKLFSAI